MVSVRSPFGTRLNHFSASELLSVCLPTRLVASSACFGFCVNRRSGILGLQSGLVAKVGGTSEISLLPPLLSTDYRHLHGLCLHVR